MSTLTISHNIFLVNTFISSILSGNNSYYCYVAKAEPWLDANGAIDDTAIIPTDSSVQQSQQNIYQNLLYGKLLNSSDVSYMIPRYDWTSNAVYAQYDDVDGALYSKNFYVVTDTNQVFKCINNSMNQPSLFKPTFATTTGTSQTPDGYIWKYMYTVDPTAYNTFQTSQFIPVTPNTQVIANSISGTIDNLVIENGGINYQVYEEGFLQSVVNNYVVQLPSTSSPFNNFYSGSSIYFKTGFSGGQLSTIQSYDATNKLLYVNPPFNYYQNIQLESVAGTFTVGDIVSQQIAYINYYGKSGYLNSGDNFVQTETKIEGTVLYANTSTVVLNEFDSGLQNYVMYNTSYSPIQMHGLVNISNGSLYVNAVSNTSFANDFPLDSYILVGTNANTNLRRVNSVNSTVITVDVAFNNNLLNANCFIVNNAISVDSSTEQKYEGSVIYTNLNSIELTIANVQPIGASFILGEDIIITNSSNVSQGSNGTVSFSNSSYLILSNINGNTTNLSNLFAYGVYSETNAKIVTNSSYPNITISTIEGKFQSGIPLICSTANGVPTGNAIIIASSTSPDELTEYIISPSVNIAGDGNGALAYCTVDLSGNNPSRSLTGITLINNGEYYTTANVTITSNTLFGNGASIVPKISPVNGHGSDPITELGAIYCGIATTFDTGVNENYKFPLYGSYRQIGIIKNPSYNDVILNVNNFVNVKMSVGNSTGSFIPKEIVLQSSTNAAGVVVYSNSSYLELKEVSGSFIGNTSLSNTATSITGLISNSKIHCILSNTTYFDLIGSNNIIIDRTSGGTGILNQVISNSSIRLTNVIGTFLTSDSINQPSINAYSNIVSIFTSNGTIDSTIGFGNKFNNTCKLTLSTNTEIFQLYERVVQNTTFATGRIISKIDEAEFSLATSNATFVSGDVIINSNTGSNCVVIFANSSYLKVSQINNSGFNESTHLSFNIGDRITNSSNTKSSVINNKYTVLVLDDVYNIVSSNTTPFIGTFGVYSGDDYLISGSNSHSIGFLSSVQLPDLVRESGNMVYMENMNSPFTRSYNTTENINLIIKF